jgi:hypothetical protein
MLRGEEAGGRDWSSGALDANDRQNKKTLAEDLPLLPVCIQSTPNLEFFSLACRDLMLASVSIGLSPEFSARAIGTESNASAKARIAYCSSPGLCDVVRMAYAEIDIGWWGNKYLHRGILNSQ